MKHSATMHWAHQGVRAICDCGWADEWRTGDMLGAVTTRREFAWHRENRTVKATIDRVELGPFHFTFLPDGDDPGIGAVQLDVGEGESWCESQTPFQVSRVDWDKFVEAT